MAGKDHTKRVRYANGCPPIFRLIAVTVWVELGPGRTWQSACNSSNSSSVMYLLFLTSRSIIIIKCTCGPPKAVHDSNRISNR